MSSDTQVLIPAGTFVQGVVDKLELKGGRGELRLQSMSITFPDGYVALVPGPLTLESDEGYALKDPGRGGVAAAFLLPIAGAGLGAVIGHAAANTQPSTITSTLPPGCTGPPPGCLTSSLTTPGSAAKATMIGAGVGSAVGMLAAVAWIFSSHHFFLDVGSPLEARLQQPLLLRQSEVNSALPHSGQHPVAQQQVAPRPVPPPGSGIPPDNGTCYTPGTPGTAPTVIPGVPGPDGVPGPPTIIPGTPPTPGTPYPCP
ncbi:MAG TPA: hypothetical protein VMG31_10715 [Verrucomicrobiae bacterium]|nr:hypothetical protein [Verrucomicrobiae bacterium]